MSFAFVPAPPPSAKVRRLAKDLEKVIEDFRRANPNTSTIEINQALRLAQHATGGATAGRIVIAVAIALLLAGLLVFYLFSAGRTG